MKKSYRDTPKNYRETPKRSDNRIETPECMRYRKEQIRKLMEEYEQVRNGLRRQEDPMSDDVRHTVLEVLKNNFAVKYGLYQCLPIILDTPGKNSRKERLEAEMNQIESNINLFEGCKTIFIANSPMEMDRLDNKVMHSGLVYKYIRKKDYMQLLRQTVSSLEDDYNKDLKERRKHEADRPDDERDTILQDLKSHYAQLYHQYQCLPIILDTPGKIARKERLEALMNQKQNDINQFEKYREEHPE